VSLNEGGVRLADGTTGSASVQFYMERGIAEGTHRSYATAIANWEKYRDSRDWSPDDDLTAMRVEEWLAALADGGGAHGRISIATIRVYFAALSNYHTKRTRSALSLLSPRVRLLLKGIERDKAVEESRQRSAKPKADALTMDLLRELEPDVRDSAQDCMLFAAAALGVATALRSSELLGTTTLQDRVLQLSQVTFFADSAGLIPCTPPGETGGCDEGRTPHHLTLTLTMSKTNQRGAPEYVHCAVLTAVLALWRWRCTRGPAPGALFKLEGHTPLRMKTLLTHLRGMLRARGHHLHLTGKSLRRGGASSLTSRGLGRAEVQILGRWASSSMPDVYADDKSKKMRALLTSAKM
jgi:hypothetical protein